MSTSVSPANLSPSWKQEVNQRIAEHRHRKGSSAPDPEAHTATQHGASRRASEAAARVAARYANAPSYSEMLASEARAALRAAEAASKAALKAQAAAQSVLDGIEAASGADPATDGQFLLVDFPERERKPELFRGDSAIGGTGRVSEDLKSSVRWDPEVPVWPAESAQAVHSPASFEIDVASWRRTTAPGELAPTGSDAPGSIAEPEEIEAFELPQPIHANLIEFPRELVATRKARPRLAEGPFAVPEPGVQLSIFEVDPGGVPIQPAADVPGSAALAWTEPRWSGIELEPQPQSEPSPEPFVAELVAAAVGELLPAPLHLRLMAALVDGATIGGALVAAAAVAAANARELPGVRETGMIAALSLLVVGTLYHVIFFTLARATPGMKYARIRLSTIAGDPPTRAQRSRRLAAMLLSVLPMGLGIAWMVFDEDSLSWHDRLSGTYLRKS